MAERRPEELEAEWLEGRSPGAEEEFRQRSESIENLDRQAALGEPGTQPGEEPLCRFAEPTG